MTWCERLRGCGADGVGPTCTVAVSTDRSMMAMVTLDMLAATTVHIAGDAAVAVGPGHRRAVDVSFRRFDRPPTPDVVSMVNASLMSCSP